MMKRIFKFIVGFYIFTIPTAEAQTVILPEGIGGVLYGYRNFANQTQRYNSEGQLEPLAKPLQKDFVGPQLLEGVGGSSLKTLATHLQRTDSFSDADNSLLNSLELGTLDGNVNAELNGHSFGVGLGLTRHFTMMVAVPYIQADVQTEISFSGRNNAQEIKQRLGALAFDELQSGLDQASQITSNQIKDTIEAEGYAPLDRWKYSGIGDIAIGGVYGLDPKRINRSISSRTMFSSFLNIPTGYVEDPDILTDVSFGKGYYSIQNTLAQTFSINNRFHLGGDLGVGLNLPTQLEKRVPEQNEGIIAQERKTTVDMTPGQDFKIIAKAAVDVGIFTLGANFGQKRHTRDSYSGSLEGNYDKLSETSEQSQTFVEFSTRLSTVELFQSKRFAVPLIVNAKYHMPISAVNSIDERYIELSLVSFFSTPMAKTIDKKKKKKRIKERYFAKNKKKKKYRKKSKRELLGH